MSAMNGLITKHSLSEFRKLLSKCRHLVVITGAGISAGSGIPTFRGENGFWRKKHAVSNFATPSSFKYDPASVWEFYHYRRELVHRCHPNDAHFALVKIEKWLKDNGRNFTLITQNVDGLHPKAGSLNVLEVHGSLFETRCTKCGNIETNLESPICKALEGKEKLFDKEFMKSEIPIEELPHCKMCGGLLRPNVVWFDEPLSRTVTDKAWKALDDTDLTLVIGTSSVVYPVAMYGNKVLGRGVPVAEFNVQKGPYTDDYTYYFEGPAEQTIPKALDLDWE